MMDFKPSELEAAICQTLTKLLRDKYDFSSRLGRTGAAVWTDDLWRELAGLGVLSVAMDEGSGGLGGDFSELAAVMRTMGHWIVDEPFLTSIVLCAGILQKSGTPMANDLLERIGAGEVRCSLAYAETAQALEAGSYGSVAVRDGERYILNGKKLFVLDAPQTDYFIVSARISEGAGAASQQKVLLLVDAKAEGVRRKNYRTIDDRHMSNITFNDVALLAETILLSGNAADDAFERAIDEGTLAVCAEACGLMEAMLEQTVEYTRQRRQFGRAISDNQVIQHKLVDMMIAVKQANSMTNIASHMLESSDRPSMVAATKSFVSKACRIVGQSAVQLHGGMGITNDIAVSHYFRRALLVEQQFGSSDEQLDRYLELSQS